MEIEGKIVHSFINLIDDNAKVEIEIDGEIYTFTFSFKDGNSRIESILSKNMTIKFIGKFDDKKKEINEISNVWVKVF